MRPGLSRMLARLLWPARWLRAAWQVGPSRASWVVSYDDAWAAREAGQ